MIWNDKFFVQATDADISEDMLAYISNFLYPSLGEFCKY